MNGLPYYKAYPRDFIEGTIGMDFETKAAYRLVLDLIYMQGGNLPDDARYISGLLGCSVKKWNTIRQKLIDAGKIEARGSYLGNYRADKELETLGKVQDRQRENRSRPNKIKEMQSPRFDHTDTDTDTDKRDKSLSSSDDDRTVDPAQSDTPEIQQAVAAYNDTAQQAGWPAVQKLTPARRAALRSRLKEAGGLEGWQFALGKARASPHLCGQNDRGWRASFDFLTTQSSFAKLMEGNYDPRPANPGCRPSGGPYPGRNGQPGGLVGAAMRSRSS